MSVRASHILLKHTGSRNPNDSYRKRPITRSHAQALQGIQEILRRLHAGEHFAEIASQLSECGSAARGGDLGSFERGMMQRPFEEAAFALDVGGMCGPVETDSGVHIILRTGQLVNI